jgi:hypothetical protein
MTIYVDENNLTVDVAINVANVLLNSEFKFIVTSQYSHQPLELDAVCTLTNARYSLFSITFPIGFGEEHKNGIYYWDLTSNMLSIQKGLAKIITEPGGRINALAFNAGPIVDNRVSEVFYRPNY